MMRFRALLLAIPLCSALSAASPAQPAGDQAPPSTPPASPNQSGLLFDPAQLPTFHGKVAAYSLAPRGGPDGLILDDGMQVSINRRLAAQLAALVKPGDAVTVHGVKAQSGSLILALSVANDASGKILISEGRRGMGRPPIVAQGKIKAQLHNRRDEVDGVLLEDGSQIRLWPGEARRLAGQLTPGQTIYASGFGEDNLLGKVVMPRRIGATEADATEVQRPPFLRFMGFHGMPWRRPTGMDGDMRGQMRGGMRGDMRPGMGRAPEDAPASPPGGPPEH